MSKLMKIFFAVLAVTVLTGASLFVFDQPDSVYAASEFGRGGPGAHQPPVPPAATRRVVGLLDPEVSPHREVQDGRGDVDDVSPLVEQRPEPSRAAPLPCRGEAMRGAEQHRGAGDRGLDSVLDGVLRRLRARHPSHCGRVPAGNYARPHE